MNEDRQKCAYPAGCPNYARRRGLCSRHGREVPAPTAGDSITERGNERDIVKVTSERVRSLEDLIRVCEIDIETWDVAEWRAVVHEMGSVPRAVGKSKNWERPSTEPVVTPLFSVSAKLRRKNGLVVTMQTLGEKLIEDIRAEVKRGPVVYAPKPRNRDEWLFEFTPFDLHLGKYAWDEETVTNYDSDIAADLFTEASDFLLDRAMKVTDGKLSRILMVVGNDASHIDSKKGTTTAGTQMDMDTRYIRVYRRLCEIHRRAADKFASVAPLDIVCVPGNHDEVTSFHLGEILATRYEGHPHITVDNSAKLRKYYEFGVNLFGFAHGDSERVNELPLLMAREVPDMWARCPSREWHIGHKHSSEKHDARGRVEQDLFSDKGIRVRRLISMSAHDAWHTRHGYTDRRACDSFVFHKEAGFTDHLSFNIDHFSGRALKI